MFWDSWKTLPRLLNQESKVKPGFAINISKRTETSSFSNELWTSPWQVFCLTIGICRTRFLRTHRRSSSLPDCADDVSGAKSMSALCTTPQQHSPWTTGGPNEITLPRSPRCGHLWFPTNLLLLRSLLCTLGHNRPIRLILLWTPRSDEFLVLRKIHSVHGAFKKKTINNYSDLSQWIPYEMLCSRYPQINNTWAFWAQQHPPSQFRNEIQFVGVIFLPVSAEFGSPGLNAANPVPAWQSLLHPIKK